MLDAAADLVDNPPLHDEDPEVDQYSGMRPRPDGGKEAETG